MGTERRPRPSTPEAMPEQERHARHTQAYDAGAAAPAWGHVNEKNTSEGALDKGVPWTQTRDADETPYAACQRDGDNSSSSGEAATQPPCCSCWQNCAKHGFCVHEAQLIRRIHDEDGACVDVVSTGQYSVNGDVRLVVYKTYDKHMSLAWLVEEEIVLLRRLSGQCPHIIKLLDSFSDPDGNTVLVMPYVSHSWTPTQPSGVRSYMRQLLQCLSFLHDQCGVMHRNIKRANILFDGHLTLIDFEGSCKHASGAVYTRFGNNLYRAPELVAAKPAHGQAASVYVYNAFDNVMSPAAESGPPSDIFSAGVVFAELLFGMRRFFDVDWLHENYTAVRDSLAGLHERRQEALLGGQPLPDPRTAFTQQLAGGGLQAEARCTRDAADLLARMLCWDPEARIRACDALSHPYFTSAGADVADDAAYDAAHAYLAGMKRKRGKEWCGRAHRQKVNSDQLQI